MSDAISTSDRALIDAAIAAGRVRRIPTGESGYPGVFWNGCDLVYDNGGPKDPEVARRRADVRAQHEAGKPVAEIANALALDVHMVRHSLRAMGIAPHPAVPSQQVYQASPETLARRDRIVPMHCSGMTKSAIAAAMGFSFSTIENDLKFLLREKRIPERIEPQGKITRRKVA